MKTAVSILGFFLTVAAAQEPGMRRPATGGFPPAGGAAGQEARGIEKKAIRAIIVYPDGVYGPDEVQRFEAAVSGLVDAVASGAKLTKADAARTANPQAEEALVREISQRLTPDNQVVVLGLTALPAGAGNRPINCPPEGCGCSQHGSGVSCSCGLLIDSQMGPWCMCLLCYEPTQLTPFKEEDLVLGSLPIKGRMQGAPGKPGQRGLLVVAVTPPDSSPQTRARLVQTGIQTAQSEPWPARVTIKIKSSPR